jgi:hypothetical protein
MSDYKSAEFWTQAVGSGWRSLVKTFTDYVDACHTLPNNGGHNFRWGTAPIVKYLWRHWGFLSRWGGLRYRFISWALRKPTQIAYFGHEKGLVPEITQVKEKWGTLRIYIAGGNDFTDGMIFALEQASAKICEDCGRPGTQTDQGWIRTLCEECKSAKK